jgi:hypothetical protein
MSGEAVGSIRDVTVVVHARLLVDLIPVLQVTGTIGQSAC